jgi:hypothetical protein
MTAPDFKMLAPCGGLPTGNYPEDKLVEYVRRDPAVLADMPEVKALVAAALEGAVKAAESWLTVSMDLNPEIWSELPDAIRAMIPEVPNDQA